MRDWNNYTILGDFRSASSNKMYTVIRSNLTGEVSCNCPGWTFKKGNQARTCAHVNLVKNNALIAATHSPNKITPGVTEYKRKVSWA